MITHIDNIKIRWRCETCNHELNTSITDALYNIGIPICPKCIERNKEIDMVLCNHAIIRAGYSPTGNIISA